jgi:hypothetical protein
MEKTAEPRQFELPLELQFSMRKAEIAAQEMTWDQLVCALLNLYHQRLMEWQAVKEVLASENISIDFDIPTEIELEELANTCMEDYEEDGDDEDEDTFCPF